MDMLDTVVVGAGVVGLATARALARAGRDVVILEAERAIGTGVTARSSEVVHAGIYYPPGSLKARLCVRGREALYRYCAARGVGVRRLGKLVVATEPGQEVALERLLGLGRAAGVDDLELLEGAHARTLEPALRCTAALLSPSTGIVDSHGLVHALLADAEADGAALAPGARVEGGRVSLDGEPVIQLDVAGTGPLGCRALVNAAGLGAPALARALGGPPPSLDPARLPSLHPVKGSYFALPGRAPFGRLIYPVPEPGGVGIHLTLDLAGQARFGPDVEPVRAIDHAVDPRRAAAFEASVRRYFPDLPVGALQPAFAGVRPRITPPGEPLADFLVLGPDTHGVPGLVHLLGIESPGLTAALALGEHVASLIEASAG